MTEIIRLPAAQGETLWAVIASLGKTDRIAEIFANRAAALEDRTWRENQVRAYAGFLRTSTQPIPRYSVTPIRRHDIPKSWRPLPALGFLRGKFI